MKFYALKAYEPWSSFSLGSDPVVEDGKTFFVFVDFLPVVDEHLVEVRVVCPSMFDAAAVEKAYQTMTRGTRAERMAMPGMTDEEAAYMDAAVLNAYGAAAVVESCSMDGGITDESFSAVMKMAEKVSSGNIARRLDAEVNAGSTGWDFLAGKRCGLVERE